jgi:hypothetical protein
LLLARLLHGCRSSPEGHPLKDRANLLSFLVGLVLCLIVLALAGVALPPDAITVASP